MKKQQGHRPTQKLYLSLTITPLVTSWLGLPLAQPHTPRNSSNYHVAHCHEPGGHSVPDCLPCGRLLQLACPQEPDITPGPRIIFGHLIWERDLRGHVATSHWVVPEARGCPWVLQGTSGRADRDPGLPDAVQRLGPWSGKPGSRSWHVAFGESLLLSGASLPCGTMGDFLGGHLCDSGRVCVPGYVPWSPWPAKVEALGR